MEDEAEKRLAVDDFFWKTDIGGQTVTGQQSMPYLLGCSL
jgi:hypothetical protein